MLQRLIARQSLIGLCRWLSSCRVFFVALLLLGGSLATAATLVGIVIGVHDGDTLTVLDSAKVQHKVRLAGIDAPELGQPWGQRSKQGLSAAAYQKLVEVDWHKRDRYGRLVGKVRIDGKDVNVSLVASGLAWHYVEYAKEQHPEERLRYASAEAAARRDRVGLWTEQAPSPPWDFRRPKRATNAQD